ncbi:peptidoglycan DD-metalloendopeptidase family protein [Phormidium pseudopriestleyi FRX01]|uniref:Peptidoglycan DD-metalloendopeptidase family protein n=1 Tax=Phormidium pseudopriestleyi FRX01 TaxID=1759528 RepID=A0ABS3FTP3_9CYAN|nr:peptidoglycan DD-metalloendopeptidase family protein [Phormidium pseudopriestleyi]MBO0350207.1 peptidoglycan DD-metalloendopeptidase family protein [Phormidium pseudopriestleyi FRX01]
MKRAFPEKVKSVPSCAADSNRTVGEIRQVLAGPRKVRTSAAMIGLAISMGASSILLPQQGEGAGASEPPIAADTSATDPGSWSTLEAETASTEEAGTQMAEQTLDGSAVEPQVQEEATPWTLTEQGPVPSQVASNPGDRGETEGTGEVNSTLPYPQELTREGNPAGASFSWQIDKIQSESGVSLEGLVQSGENRLDPSLAELWSEESVSSVVESSLGMSQESDGPGPEMAPSGLFPTVEPQESTEGTVVEPLSLEGRANDPLLGGIRAEEETTPSPVNSERTSPGWQSYLEENSTGNAWENSPPAQTEVNSGETSGLVPLVRPELESAQEEAVQPELSSFPSAENDDRTALDLVEPDMNGAIAIPSVESGLASRIYQVSFGDTLDAIALRNGVSAQKIVEANSLNDPDLLEVNQTLKIPLSSTEPGPNSIAWDPSSLTRDEGSDLTASAKSDVVALPKQIETDTTFSLIAPSKPSEAIASIPETVVSMIDRSPERSSDLMTGDRSVSEEMRSAIGIETLVAQAAPSVETQADESDHIDGLRADILKLRQKYREQEALGQHSQIEAVETTSQRYGEISVAENSPRVQPALSSQADESSSFPESIQAHAIEPEAIENRYVDSLRAEIEKLREKYKTENLSLEPTGESVPVALPNTLAVRSTSTAPEGPSDRINPQFNPQPNETLENAPRAQETQQEQILAVAPVGSEVYAPLMQPAVGQVVSPELPPLKTPDTYLPDSQPTFNGYIWPAHGVFTSGYGWRWGRMHRGIDIAGPTGTPIYAAATGVVVTAGWNSGGYGNLVEIEHPDGSVTLYAHNHRIMVQEGQQVDQGQQVAEMGSTGFSTGPHLHFEIHPSGQGAVNPMALLPPE